MAVISAIRGGREKQSKETEEEEKEVDENETKKKKKGFGELTVHINCPS